MQFSFPYSHAFPGGRVIVDGDDAAEGACEVEFAGVTVIGAWRREGEEALHLDVPAYRTTYGTEVTGRCWRWRSQRIG